MGRDAVSLISRSLEMCRPVRLYYELLYTSYANTDSRHLRHHDTDEYREVFEGESEVR